MAPKVLLVVAQMFNGHELWMTMKVLAREGIEAEVISTKRIMKDEVTMEQFATKRTIKDVHPDELDDFDGLMVISGNMKLTEAYWKNPRVLDYVMRNQPKPTAAICCSVPTIRHMAKGKEVSFFPLIRSRDLLRRAGAVLSNTSLSVDGNLVTAENQMLTETWAEQFAALVKGEPATAHVKDSGFRAGGLTPRKTPPDIQRLRDQKDN
jgi:putative intracellular protease/amidase